MRTYPTYRFRGRWLLVVATLLLLPTLASASEKVFYLKVAFSDGLTFAPLDNVEVTITNLRTKNATRLITGENGLLNITLRDEAIFSIIGKKGNYFSSGNKTISTIGRSDESILEIEVHMRPIAVGATYNIEGIAFGVNSSRLSFTSQLILEDLAYLMMQHPGLKIQVNCHTDSRGDDTYNAQLSQERADAIVKYLIRVGVPYSSITGKGYGESVLLNHCENDVKCPSTLHEQNRRVEFQVLSTHF